MYPEYQTRRVDCGGHAVTIHAPIRTESEQEAYLERIDAAIRRAFAGWKLRRPAAEEKEEIVVCGHGTHSRTDTAYA